MHDTTSLYPGWEYKELFQLVSVFDEKAYRALYGARTRFACGIVGNILYKGS